MLWIADTGPLMRRFTATTFLNIFKVYMTLLMMIFLLLNLTCYGVMGNLLIVCMYGCYLSYRIQESVSFSNRGLIIVYWCAWGSILSGPFVV